MSLEAADLIVYGLIVLLNSLMRRENTLYVHTFSDYLIYFCLEKLVMFSKYRQVL